MQCWILSVPDWERLKFGDERSFSVPPEAMEAVCDMCPPIMSDGEHAAPQQ